MSELDVKEAEERARLALQGLLPGQHGTRIVDLVEMIPRDVLALADLARRLAEAMVIVEHHGSPCLACRQGDLLLEARKAGLLPTEGS